ncbi:type IV secretory system conjugative DNA transfer family protein [Legionella sp. MW5194]|uniref:type IV secretory system conjugative DNA transfer family protein n=1 Tax=Legionella sp. MW5194 TaxID=2662448 RepID=UPI00193D255B|nr:type IV secretory system conjugative DNA transfer family protein [Legionella sp. MW5194]
MKWVSALSVVVLILELITLVALRLTGLPQWPTPLSGIALWQHGFGMELLLGFLLVGVPLVIVVGLRQTGFCRYLSALAGGVFVAGVVMVLAGIALFAWFEEVNINSYPTLCWLLQSDDTALMHFKYCMAASMGLFFLVFGVIAFERLRPASKALGNAHFANGFEIQRAGFFNREAESIVIGKKWDAPLYANGFEHVLVFAPSGSGKTRSIAIPNLLHYPYSVVCNDVKLTLYETTAGFRQTMLGHACYCFAPAHPEGRTHRFNPLSAISRDKTERMTDIQRIGHILMPDNSKDPIWTQASRKLFKTLVLYLLDANERPVTLGEINRLVKQQNFDAWLQEQLDTTDHFDPEFYRNGYSYINNHDKTRSSILETFSGYFELFDDPRIDAATCASDFDFRDLRRKKMTLYVGFSDDDMERLAPLLTLFWQQLISAMIREIPNPNKEPYPLLCLIDEFSSLGRIERLRRSLKLLREYRVRCVLMFQYIAQTFEKYSHDEARAFTNIKTKIAFATEDIQDAEFISKMLGTRTKRVMSRSVSDQHHGISDSKTMSYQAIPLMRPDELMKMPAHVNLILRSGSSPIKARQAVWYENPAMKDSVLPPPPVPKQTIKASPFIRAETIESLD